MKRIVCASIMTVAIGIAHLSEADSTRVVVANAPVAVVATVAVEPDDADQTPAAELQQQAVDVTVAAQEKIEAEQQQLQDQQEKAQEMAERAQADAENLAAQVSRNYGQTFAYSWGNSSGNHSAERSLVIRSADLDAKTLKTAEEDLNIMGRILEKALYSKGDDEQQAQAMGIKLMTFGKSGHPKNLLIEGYGAIFMLNVNFPLMGPPTKSEENTTNETSSSSWDEAKQELYGQPVGADQDPFNQGSPRDDFDAKRVDNLKDSVLEALKNASNIRALKSDEHITVVISSGGDRGSDVWTISRKLSGLGRAQGGGYGVGGGGGGNGAKAAPRPPRAAINRVTPSPRSDGGSVLTLRVKKSDVDAYAKGKLTDEEFHNKATILVY